MLYIVKVMFILWVVNEINEFSQHHKPSPPIQELKCNKSLFMFRYLWDSKDLGFLYRENYMSTRTKNYSFCMLRWMNRIKAWTLFSLLYNKDSNLLKAISITKLLGNALAKVAICQPNMFSSFILLKIKTIKFCIFFMLIFWCGGKKKLILWVSCIHHAQHTLKKLYVSLKSITQFYTSTFGHSNYFGCDFSMYSLQKSIIFSVIISNL